MRDILTRVFGPDPNPSSPLPTLPYGGYAAGCHIHSWLPRERSELMYWECVVCYAETAHRPAEDE